MSYEYSHYKCIWERAAIDAIPSTLCRRVQGLYAVIYIYDRTLSIQSIGGTSVYIGSYSMNPGINRRQYSESTPLVGVPLPLYMSICKYYSHIQLVHMNIEPTHMTYECRQRTIYRLMDYIYKCRPTQCVYNYILRTKLYTIPIVDEYTI